LGDDRSLFDVALHLHMSPSTARNQYRAAFQLITGHSYSAATWIRIFGPRKYPPDLMSDINGAVMRRRQQPRGSRPPVPESSLARNAEQSSIIDQSPSAANHDITLWEIIEDVRTMTRAGRTDTEIAEHLEISLDVVALLKQRIDNE
jgi:DNA-binding CsgD family transcriptional regulator